MMDVIIRHWPALQVLLPFIAALFAILSFNIHIAWYLCIIFASASFALSVYVLGYIDGSYSYCFGNWHPSIGIEYLLDSFNQKLIIYSNLLLLLFIIFNKSLISDLLLKYVNQSRRNLFFVLLFFAHAGYIGILSTNDLFNLYVFIEIASLATYVILSQGPSNKALIGAFDYLVIGTIGATFILIAIGFIFAMTGSLNITDVRQILSSQAISNLHVISIVFFLLGVLLKLALFPMHFWMMRAYKSTAKCSLVYIATIPTITGLYMVARFVDYAINLDALYISDLGEIIRLFFISISILSAILALFFSKDLMTLLVYSSISSLGYILLLILVSNNSEFLLRFIIADSINKSSLFLVISYIAQKNSDFNLQRFKLIHDKKLFIVLTIFTLIASAGLPISNLFILKLELFTLLLSKHLYIEFFAMVISSIFVLLYHLRIAKVFFFSSKSNGSITIDSNCLGLSVFILIQLIFLFINCSD
ncbi:proton-conducting transporter transmembrane domain-containing protein [Rickettsia endosymbiont of Cardiosporidium cionae]|uniref:proton-conducting transporter transmembrane domain-containing protein n=1 Tax=Rickettsia endosymbiont of Cardiosporidium cionae TaxID=2777155 RepID=UPI0018954072|nr:proton-conducting transporter membrane subunit [Rickettsia endosymbiont of Cardiosporidium cionae]KAF8818244.1 hypothetical protein IHI24_000703 [Rickettsia endosymbiont of Cardiosporidium cionae]